jgi:transcriptional regulator with XRE-family HTH domain
MVRQAGDVVWREVGALMTAETFGQAVKRLRRARGWSQEELGAAAGELGQSAISAIEVGRVQPTMETVRRLARALDQPLHDFAALAGHLDPRELAESDDLREEVVRAVFANQQLAADLAFAREHDPEFYPRLLEDAVQMMAVAMGIQLRQRGLANAAPK